MARTTRSARACAQQARRISTCPKCGGQMVNGVCTKCKFSEKSAYQSREQAKEFTHSG